MSDDANSKGPAAANAMAGRQWAGDGGLISDSELLRRYAEDKSEPAFASLVQRHLDLVYSAALRRLSGDAHAAADVAQQVFIALAGQAAALTRCAVLPGWLYATTRNVAVDFIRAEQRRRVREQEAHTMHELTSTPLSDAAWEQMRPVLDDVMDELSDADRQIVVLRFFAKRPFADIGAALKLSEDAARMRVERALEKLRTLLARRGITSRVGALATVLANEAATAAPSGLVGSVTGAALASAAAGGAAAAALGWLQFMSSTKFGFGAAAVLGFLALGTAGYNLRAQRAAEASLASAQAEVDALFGKLRGLELSAGATAQTVNEPTPAVDATETNTPAGVAHAVVAWDPVAEGIAFMRRHPAVWQTHLDEGRADFNFRWRPLFQSLGLAPAEIEQVRAAWLRSAQTTGSLDGKPVVFASDDTISYVESEELLRSLLGEERYPEVARHKQTRQPALNLTARLAAALAFSEAPMSAEQGGQFAEIAAGHYVREAGAKTRRFDWEAIVIKARGILSATQIQALEQARAVATLDARIAVSKSAK